MKIDARLPIQKERDEAKKTIESLNNIIVGRDETIVGLNTQANELLASNGRLNEEIRSLRGKLENVQPKLDDLTAIINMISVNVEVQ